MQSNPNKYLIAKPGGGTLAQGIFLFNKQEEIPKGQFTVQEYLGEELLLFNGHKSDTRAIFVVTSIDPLIAYYHPAGFTRGTKEKYAMPTAENKNNKAIHITTLRATFTDHSRVPKTDSGDRACTSQIEFLRILDRKPKKFSFTSEALDLM